MPLDPQVRALLDEMAAQDQAPLPDMDPAQARVMMRQLATLARYPDQRGADGRPEHPRTGRRCADTCLRPRGE